MEKEKSFNQFTANCDKDCHFSGDANISGNESKHYRRDFLLQLRLHPLSLQKPDNLPKVEEVVKDKLNLHNINDSGTESLEKLPDINNPYSSLKSDYLSIKQEYNYFSPYVNKMLPYCYPPSVYNGTYPHIAPQKYRLPSHPYGVHIKKPFAPIYSYPKDFDVDQCLWTKRYPSDNVWTCYPSHIPNGFNKRKEDLESNKIKKKLSIIDPATGKNILENVNESVECGDNKVTESDKHDDCFKDENEFEKLLHTVNMLDSDAASCHKIEKDIHSDNTTADVPPESTSGNAKKYEDVKKSASIDDGLSINNQDSVKSSKNKDVTSSMHASLDDNCDFNDNDVTNITESKSGAFKEPNLKSFQNKETSQSSNLQADAKRGCCIHGCEGKTSKHEESVKDTLRQLKDNICTLRQEQEKMSVFQSFLRYKKHQLEELAKNLDEKRIEIANWEYSLFNKAKKMNEQKQWLQCKSEMLYDKALKLSQREKYLNQAENLNSSTLTNTSNSPLDKLNTDDEQDVAWESVNSKNYDFQNKETGNSDYNCHSSRMNYVSPATDALKCKSVISSLDELEKNIVFIEKIDEIQEMAHSHSITKAGADASSPKENESSLSESLGPSKGRRYLPEHIKYWLNNKNM